MTTTPPGTLIIPPRPVWPMDEQRRADLQMARHAILDQDFDEVAEDWFKAHWDDDRRAAMGPPDTSANPLADICRQLSTPGLYGMPPSVRHVNARNDRLIGEKGYLRASGVFTKLKHVQYMSLGLGDYFVRLDVINERLIVRLVAPHNVLYWASEAVPDEPLMIVELRLRSVMRGGKVSVIWTYDVLDLGLDEYGGTSREPSFRILDAAKVSIGSMGPELLAEPDVDLTSTFVRGGIPKYPYLDRGRRPFLPYVRYSSDDTGQRWNHRANKGATKGTLNSVLNWTYAGHAAQSASGKAVIIAGLEPVGVDIRAPQAGLSDTVRVRSLSLLPGSAVYHEVKPGQSPFVNEIGPGAELSTLAAYAMTYDDRLAVSVGLSASDITKTHANPTSGAALAVSNKAKREHANRATELYRKADLAMVATAAKLLNTAGLGEFDEDGYSIGYVSIPRDASELAAEREQDDWDVANNYASPIEIYQRRHPGASAEDAEQAIVESRIEKLKLEQKVSAKAIGLGLVSPPAVTSERLAAFDKVMAVVRDVKSGAIARESGRALLLLLGQTETEADNLLPPIEEGDEDADAMPTLPGGSDEPPVGSVRAEDGARDGADEGRGEGLGGEERTGEDAGE